MSKFGKKRRLFLMTKKEECFYCSKNQQLQNLMTEVIELEVSTVYLNKDQTHKGRCIIALNEHKNELFELDQIELQLFMKDVARAAEAIKSVFGADKINYAIYGDLVSHLHFHLVPKNRNSIEWGEAFTNSPSNKKNIDINEFESSISLIKSSLAKTEV